MTATDTQKVTPLDAARRELEMADEAVRQVEREIAPTLDKFSQAHLTLDEVLQTRGPNVPEAKKARATIAALSGQVAADRARLERVQRKRSAAAEKVASERRAIAHIREAIAVQDQREARQAAVIDDYERQLREKRVALDVEREQGRLLREQLGALVGEEDV